MTAHRKRRIAADEAHSWARNLRLRNPYAKLVLGMLSLYVDGAGSCFVGIEALSEDTELSTDTVRKRLAWLEGVGAIARFPQWIDANGRRNSDERGKRTSDEIRLLMNADPEDIEARAHGENEPSNEPEPGKSEPSIPAVSPSHQQGQQSENKTAGPPLALCQPSDSGKGLTSEPEPEDSPPNPPPGGVRSDFDVQLDDDLARLAEVYPIPITDMPRTRAVLGAMTERERADVVTGAKGYAAFIESERRRTGGKGRAVKDAHRWIKDGGHVGYLQAGRQAEAVAGRYSAIEDTEQWNAWMVFYRLCGESQGIPAFLISALNGHRAANVASEWPPVGRGIDPDRSKWLHKAVQYGDARGASFAAWLRTLRLVPNVRVSTRSEFLDGEYRATLTVPQEFPPTKAAHHAPLSESEAKDFTDTG